MRSSSTAARERLGGERTIRPSNHPSNIPFAGWMDERFVWKLFKGTGQREFIKKLVAWCVLNWTIASSVPISSPPPRFFPNPCQIISIIIFFFSLSFVTVLLFCRPQWNFNYWKEWVENFWNLLQSGDRVDEVGVGWIGQGTRQSPICYFTIYLLIWQIRTMFRMTGYYYISSCWTQMVNGKTCSSISASSPSTSSSSRNGLDGGGGLKVIWQS